MTLPEAAMLSATLALTWFALARTLPTNVYHPSDRRRRMLPDAAIAFLLIWFGTVYVLVRRLADLTAKLEEAEQRASQIARAQHAFIHATREECGNIRACIVSTVSPLNDRVIKLEQATQEVPRWMRN